MTAPTARAALGQRAEDACAHYLFARGYTLLARNLRLGHLEVDILARKGPLVALVEVRTRGRGALEGPLASVSGRKKMYLLRAADRVWRWKASQIQGVERIRIDVAAVRFVDGGTFVDYFDGAVVGGFGRRG